MLTTIFSTLSLFFGFAGFWGWLSGLAVEVVTFWTLSFFLFWGLIILFCLYHGVINHRYWVTGVLFGLILVVLFFLGAVAPLAWIIENPYKTAIIFFGYFIIAPLWMVFRWWTFIEKVRRERAEKIRSFLKYQFRDVVKHHAKKLQREKLEREEAEKERNNPTSGISFRGVVEPSPVAKSAPSEDADAKAILDESTPWFDALKADGLSPEEPGYLTTALNRHLGNSEYGNDVSDLGTATSAPLFRDHKRKFFTYFFYWPLDVLVYFFGELVQDAWEFIVRVFQKGFDRWASGRIRQKIDL